MSSTREHILRAAVELFSERGYSRTTVRDICHQANANIAAVNYHFKGKRDLGNAVIDLLFENMHEKWANFPGADKIKDAGAWEQAIYDFIYNFIHDRDREEYNNYYRSRLIFRELNNPSELFEPMYQKYLNPIQEQLKELIRLGLPEGADEKEATMWFVTIMAQCIFFRKKPVAETNLEQLDFTDLENVERVTRHITGTVLSGLKFKE